MPTVGGEALGVGTRVNTGGTTRSLWVRSSPCPTSERGTTRRCRRLSAGRARAQPGCTWSGTRRSRNCSNTSASSRFPRRHLRNSTRPSSPGVSPRARTRAGTGAPAWRSRFSSGASGPAARTASEISAIPQEATGGGGLRHPPPRQSVGAWLRPPRRSHDPRWPIVCHAPIVTCKGHSSEPGLGGGLQVREAGEPATAAGRRMGAWVAQGGTR
jgi:hypothetical protein